MTQLSVELYSSANAFIKTLDDVKQISFRDVNGDAGSGQIEMDYGDADLADCTRKRILKFLDDGDTKFACVIGPRSQSTIGAQEKASKRRSLGGVGVAGLLRNACVLSELDVGLQSPQQRGFGYMSSDFDDSAWDAATQLYLQGEPVFGYGPLYPAGWPDSTAWWIWSRLPEATPGPTLPPMPVGKIYARKQLVVPDDGEVAFYIACDDAWKMWVAADMVAQRNEAYAWREVTTHKMFLPAGTYQLAFELENVARPSVETNYAGFLFAAYSTGFGGINVDLLLHSDDTWLVSDYPTEAPGMTPGALWQIVLDELHFLGFLTEVTQGAWTDALDSDGNAWTETVCMTVPVGQDLFTLARAMDATCMDWWIDPDTLQLELYNQGARGGSSGVTLSEGTHYRDLSHQDAEQPPTHLLVRKSTGEWTLLDSGDSSQPVLTYMDAGGAPDDGQATKSGAAVFAHPADTLSAAVESRSGAEPWVDYTPGQTFSTIDIGGTVRTWTLDSITAASLPENDDGRVGGEALYAIEAHR